MAGDYIRREDARRMVVQLDKYAWKSPVSGERRVTVDVDLVKFGLDRIPAADVAEVVRCKDCEHSTLPSELTQRYGKPGTLTCHNMHAPSNRRNVGSNDFCSYGERREGGSDVPG